MVAATSRTRHVLRTSSCSGSTTDWLAELAGRLSGSEAGMMSPVPERKRQGQCPRLTKSATVLHFSLQCPVCCSVKNMLLHLCSDLCYYSRLELPHFLGDN